MISVCFLDFTGCPGIRKESLDLQNYLQVFFHLFQVNAPLMWKTSQLIWVASQQAGFSWKKGAN